MGQSWHWAKRNDWTKISQPSIKMMIWYHICIYKIKSDLAAIFSKTNRSRAVLVLVNHFLSLRPCDSIAIDFYSVQYKHHAFHNYFQDFQDCAKFSLNTKIAFQLWQFRIQICHQMYHMEIAYIHVMSIKMYKYDLRSDSIPWHRKSSVLKTVKGLIQEYSFLDQ